MTVNLNPRLPDVMRHADVEHAPAAQPDGTAFKFATVTPKRVRSKAARLLQALRFLPSGAAAQRASRGKPQKNNKLEDRCSALLKRLSGKTATRDDSVAIQKLLEKLASHAYTASPRASTTGEFSASPWGASIQQLVDNMDAEQLVSLRTGVLSKAESRQAMLNGVHPRLQRALAPMLEHIEHTVSDTCDQRRIALRLSEIGKIPIAEWCRAQADLARQPAARAQINAALDGLWTELLATGTRKADTPQVLTAAMNKLLDKEFGKLAAFVSMNRDKPWTFATLNNILEQDLSVATEQSNARIRYLAPLLSAEGKQQAARRIARAKQSLREIFIDRTEKASTRQIAYNDLMALRTKSLPRTTIQFVRELEPYRYTGQKTIPESLTAKIGRYSETEFREIVNQLAIYDSTAWALELLNNILKKDVATKTKRAENRRYCLDALQSAAASEIKRKMTTAAWDVVTELEQQFEAHRSLSANNTRPLINTRLVADQTEALHRIVAQLGGEHLWRSGDADQVRTRVIASALATQRVRPEMIRHYLGHFDQPLLLELRLEIDKLSRDKQIMHNDLAPLVPEIHSELVARERAILQDIALRRAQLTALLNDLSTFRGNFDHISPGQVHILHQLNREIREQYTAVLNLPLASETYIAAMADRTSARSSEDVGNTQPVQPIYATPVKARVHDTPPDPAPGPSPTVPQNVQPTKQQSNDSESYAATMARRNSTTSFDGFETMQSVQPIYATPVKARAPSTPPDPAPGPTVPQHQQPMTSPAQASDEADPARDGEPATPIYDVPTIATQLSNESGYTSDRAVRA